MAMTAAESVKGVAGVTVPDSVDLRRIPPLRPSCEFVSTYDDTRSIFV
jgi:hypothetical protein